MHLPSGRRRRSSTLSDDVIAQSLGTGHYLTGAGPLPPPGVLAQQLTFKVPCRSSY